MDRTREKPTVAVLLSGGIDSAVLAGSLAADGTRVQPLFVRGGLIWEPEELAAVHSFLSALPPSNLCELVVLDQPLADLYSDHWSIDGRAAPGAGTPDEAVYLPGRNPLLLVKAVVWCRLRGIDELALATLSANPFGDATDEFFADFERALRRALGGAPRITRPYARLTKTEVIRRGREMPLELTFSCIRPVAGRHCGACNKCEERQRAFQSAGVADRTAYARAVT